MVFFLASLLTPAPTCRSAEPDPRMVAPSNGISGRLPSIAPTLARDAAKTFRMLENEPTPTPDQATPNASPDSTPGAPTPRRRTAAKKSAATGGAAATARRRPAKKTAAPPEMTAAAERRRILELELREALMLGQFEAHYQPQINVKTGAVSGASCNARFSGPRTSPARDPA